MTGKRRRTRFKPTSAPWPPGPIPIPNPEPATVPWTRAHTVTLLTTNLWKKGELAAFFNRAGIGDRVAFFMAFAALLEEKAEAERERIARDRVVDELLKRRAETRATIAELAAIMKAIEPRAIEEHPADTLIALQRRRAGNSAVTRRGKREAWLGELKKSTNDMRGRNPALTDDDILDKLIGPGGSWPPGIWHPSRGYMKTGFTLLYKEKKITPRSKTPLPR